MAHPASGTRSSSILMLDARDMSERGGRREGGVAQESQSCSCGETTRFNAHLYLRALLAPDLVRASSQLHGSVFSTTWQPKCWVEPGWPDARGLRADARRLNGQVRERLGRARADAPRERADARARALTSLASARGRPWRVRGRSGAQARTPRSHRPQIHQI